MSPDLQARMRSQVVSGPSLVPQPSIAPPPRQDEVIPSIQEVVKDAVDRLRLARLVTRHMELSEITDSPTVKAAIHEKKGIGEQIKKILGKWQVGKATYEGTGLTYYSSPRSAISRSLLLDNGVDPITIDRCTETKYSYNLRITARGGDDTSGE